MGVETVSVARVGSLGIFCSLALIIHSSSAFGQVSVEHDSATGNLFLKADGCAELKGEVDAIKSWTVSLAELPPEDNIDCTKTPDLKKFDIKPFLPSAVREIYGKFPSCNGPNCWNNALVLKKLVKHPRHTTAKEWREHLDANCKRVPVGEKPRPGDLVAVREVTSQYTFSEIHGFTYLNHLSCTKNGLNAESACILEPFESVVGGYGVKDLQNCLNPKDLPPSNCTFFVSFFRCETTFDVYQEQALLDIEQEVSFCTLDRNLTGIEDLVKKVSETRRLFAPNRKLKGLRRAIFDAMETQLDELMFERSYDEVSNADSKSPPSQKTNLMNESLLMVAIRKGDFTRVKALIEGGADKEFRNYHGRTPLHIAAEVGNKETVQLLIDAGADVNATSNDGRSIMDIASQRKDVERDHVVLMLREANKKGSLNE